MKHAFAWRRLLAPTVLLSLVTVLLSSPAEARPDKAADSVYIVQMADDPIVAYDGGEPGLAPTKPARGQHVNPNSARVRRYQDFLERRHAAALAAASAPASAKFYDYTFSFNGFAATLTPAQARSLARQPGVVAVSPDERRELATDNTPGELGLTGPGGFWEGYEQTGEDVIIGVIDSGIWPEHPSFSDQVGLRLPAGSCRRCPAGLRCAAGALEREVRIRSAVVPEGLQQQADRRSLLRYGLPPPVRGQPEDFISPRDHDGHGTHTASTAGGNEGVDPSIFGRDLGVDTISGMAPRARIAAYKACFGTGGCFLVDLLKAIDAAVADGVDVINYSIGSATPQLTFARRGRLSCSQQTPACSSLRQRATPGRIRAPSVRRPPRRG